MTVIPVYCRAWSIEAESRSRVTEEIIKAVDLVSGQIGDIGTWTIDRQGDNNALIEKFVKDGERFVIRLRFNRLVFYGDKARISGDFS